VPPYQAFDRMAGGADLRVRPGQLPRPATLHPALAPWVRGRVQAQTVIAFDPRYWAPVAIFWTMLEISSGSSI
jgi:hypothetical protein